MPLCRGASAGGMRTTDQGKTSPGAGAGTDSDSDTGAYEAMLQFLYEAPIGLVQIAADGTVELMNPMAASLLMAISPRAGLDNLFDALEGVTPQLRQVAGTSFPRSSSSASPRSAGSSVHSGTTSSNRSANSSSPGPACWANSPHACWR